MQTRVALVAALALGVCGVVRSAVPAVQSGTWSPGPSLAAPRADAASVLLAQGGVLVTGGTAEDGAALDDVELFDGISHFSPVVPMTTARARHTATLLADGRVLVVGGQDAGVPNATAEVFDDGVWYAAGGLADARFGHTATLLEDGRVLVAGGSGVSGPVATLEIFDPATLSFTPAGTLAAARAHHAAAMLANGRVLIAGGFDGESPLTSIELFDPAAGTATTAQASLNVARAGLSATRLLDGRVLLFGGHDGTSELASGELYDAASDVISVSPSASAPRRDHKAFLLPNNNAVLIAGGYGAAGALATAELYLPWANEFRATGSLASARAGAAGGPLSAENYGAPADTDGLLLLAGGAGQSSSELYGFATIRTDKDDYAPGMTVYVSGRGWMPNETVTLGLIELPDQHEARTFTIQADEQGNIVDAMLFEVELHHLDVRFRLTARGAASEAQTTFTDANIANNLAVSPGTRTVAAGGSTTYTVTVGFGGNTTACTAELALGALPLGVSGVFDPPTVTGASDNTPKTATLTITTTASGPSATPVGTHALTVIAGTGAGCTGSDRQATATLQVTEGPRTTTTMVTSTANPATYGDTVTFTAAVTATAGNPAGAGAVTFRNGDATLCASVPLSGNTASCSTATLPAGSHGITAEYSGTTSGSPRFAGSTSAPLAQAIDPKQVTGSFEAADREYDGTPEATIVSRSLAGVVGSDDVSLAGGTAAFADASAGTDKTVTGTGFTLAGTAAGNYVLTSTTLTSTANITPRALTVTATGESRVYDGTTNATVVLAADEIEGDDINLTYAAANFADKHIGAGKAITVTGIAVGGADAGNYTFNTTATTTADITPRPLTVTAAAEDKIYDGTASASVTLSDDRVAGDSLTLDYTTASFTDKHVGTDKTVTVAGITVSGADAGNYTFNTTATTTADMTPRALTVTAAAEDKVYDGTTSATVALADDRIAGDDLTLASTSATFVDKHVGTDKTVTVAGITISGADAGNYTFNTTATTTADITPRALTVTAAAEDKVYDGTTAATVTLGDDRVLGDSLTLASTGAGFADKHVGTDKLVSVSGISVSGPDAGNYTHNAATTTTADITPAALTITASSHTGVIVGSPVPVIAPSYSGFVSGDAPANSLTVEPTCETTYTVSSPVGTHPATCTGAVAPNYTITYVAGQVQVIFGWSGYLQPISDTAHQVGAAMSRFKAGQTIPARFVLLNHDGLPVLQAGNPQFFRSANLGSCDAGGALETVDSLTPDVVPEFKVTGGEYHYNWSTRGLSPGLYRIFARLADETDRHVDICLTK